MMKTILITGINGFLGSHLALLLKNEYNVIGLEYNIDNLFRINHLNLKVYSSDENLEAIFIRENIYAVIHTATIYRRKNEPIKDLLNTNIILPAILFEFSEKYKVEIFVNTDSFFNSNQNKTYNYLQDYTLSKQNALQWLQLQRQECNLVNMKIFHMFGENDSPSKFVPHIIEELKQNNPIDLTKGEQTRDFIYIKDVVNAYKTVLSTQFNKSFCEFDVCTGNSITIKAFVETAKEATSSSSVLNWGVLPYRENEIMTSTGNPAPLIALGWKPKHAVKDVFSKWKTPNAAVSKLTLFNEGGGKLTFSINFRYLAA
ncbi:MAG: NAD-dependent epimerase/dehydratase [Dysgonamonadaceae bacterium]|nr:NAD-dependent epimerase/dehydratase [Dysgonamonadaceae bacterium]